MPGCSLDAGEFSAMLIDAMSAGQSVGSLDRASYIIHVTDEI